MIYGNAQPTKTKKNLISSILRVSVIMYVHEKSFDTHDFQFSSVFKNMFS